MKTISVEQLHRQTDELVRRAAVEDIVVAEGGRPLAVLTRFGEAERLRRHWEEREHALAALPVLGTDSTRFVSEDREGR
jgi:antitoxin (DNA-binding transcriptional repressor) of toxin-antitoxin stability system